MKEKIKLILQREREVLVLYGLFVLVNSIPCFFLSAPTFGDALNTMAPAAFLAGHDWKNYMAADGYVYKYGLSLFYLIPFLFLRPSAFLYKLLLIINVLLAGIVPVVAYKIGRTYLKVSRKQSAFWLAGVVSFLPAMTLNIKFTWAETLLFICPWLICWVLLKLYFKPESGTYSALAGVASVVPYMAHERGIVFFMASVLTLVHMRFFCGRRQWNWKPFLAVSALLLIVDRFLNSMSHRLVFGVTEASSNVSFQLFDGQLWQRIFSFEGMQTWIKLVYGWLFNLFTGSFGLCCIGLWVCGMYVFCRRKRREISSQHIMAVFAALCFLGAFAMGGLFFFDDIDRYYAGELIKRSDKLVYGRYLESSISIPCFLGLYALTERKRAFTKKWVFILALIMGSVYLFFLVNIAPYMEGAPTWPHTTITINTFCRVKEVARGYLPIPEFGFGLSITGGVSLAVFLGVLLLRKWPLNVFRGLTLLFTAVFFWGTFHVTYAMDRYEVEQMAGITGLRDEFDKLPVEYKVIFLDDEITRSSYQYVFYDYYIVTKRDKRADTIKNMIMVSPKGQVNSLLYEDDYFRILEGEAAPESSDYYVYIKGQELNEWCGKNGLKTEILTVPKHKKDGA